MADPPRILVFSESSDNLPIQWEESKVDIVHVQHFLDGLALLQVESFDGVYLTTENINVWQRASSLLQADHILRVMNEGVAVVNADLSIIWANSKFDEWCGKSSLGESFYEALNSPEILGPDYHPFHTALSGKDVRTRVHCSENRYLELHITPVRNRQGKVRQLISLCRNVTAEMHQQQMLDALNQAGRELAALDAGNLADMNIAERVELLKYNIKRFTHDLLHYDVIEIRILEPANGELKPLLSEGMTQEAENRKLSASEDGNGVTGFVAATGKSYLCPDTANDPRYLQGAEGAKSSLTVPLMFGEQVVGTFNVESPKTQAFTDQDLQFTEIFSREIANVLHTLELLSAEKHTTATQSIEAVTCEVALPVDEILTNATAILEKWIGHEPEMIAKLKAILASARSIKECIQTVGENITPPDRSVSGLAPAQSARLKGVRVLVADNDDRVRRSAHRILGRLGCIVETARDGQEALTMARLSKYDAMLADIRLPDLSGYDVYQGLRRARPKANVILMTGFGYDPSHAIVKARQDGLTNVLYKPFRVDQLLAVLGDVRNTGDQQG